MSATRPTSLPTGDPSALPPGVLAVRPGPGANCSSIGSAIDILFVAATATAAVLAAVAALASAKERAPQSGPTEPDDAAPR